MTKEKINALTMPKWGLSMTEGKVLEWLVDVGDEVSSGEEIMEVETEKISSAVESPYTGKLLKMVSEVGDMVPVGGLLGVIGDDSVTDQDIEDYVSQFQAEFVPEDNSDEEEKDIYSWAELSSHTLRYLDTGAGNDVVIMVHGFAGDLGNWLFNYQALGEGRRVIMVDLPGHGESTKDVGDGSFDFFSDILKEFVDHLKIQNASLIAHSMGGAVCINFAAKYPQYVKSLVLIAPAGIGSEIDSGYIEGFVSSNSRRGLKPELEKLYIDKSLVTRQFVDNMLKYKRIDGVQECLEQIKSRLLDDKGNQREVLLNKLIDLEMPIQVIWGEQDEIIYSNQLGEVANRDNIKTILFANAGHMLQLEEHNKVNTEINDFLS